jgi:putative SOS response-associated peptidase YedK
MNDYGANKPPMSGVYPDYEAPVVLKDGEGNRVMRDLRWGMPSSKKALHDATVKRADKLRAKGQVIDDATFAGMLRMEPDRGTTNVRNTTSTHWRRWLGPANRCLVPFTSFSEPDQVGGSLQPVWFALSEDRPVAFFAGIWTGWTCVRKAKEGEVTCDLYGFLTTDAAEPVATFHSKAMPVILTEEAEWDEWMSDKPWGEVEHLQRPLAAGALKVVARGVRQDETAPA